MVQFFFLEKNITLTKRTLLKQFISSIFFKEKKDLDSLTYIFCSDNYLLEINKTYLKHDYFTDIITFCLSEPTQPIVGEIYISIDRVKDNAKTHGTSIREELHRVVFHGALHLCGYLDKTNKDAQLMRRMENKYLTKYFN